MANRSVAVNIDLTCIMNSKKRFKINNGLKIATKCTFRCWTLIAMQAS